MDATYSARINRNSRDLASAVESMRRRFDFFPSDFTPADMQFVNDLQALAHALKLFADLVGVIVMMRMPVPPALTPEYMAAVDTELATCVVLCSGYVNSRHSLEHVKEGMGRMATLHANGNPGFGFGQD